MCFPIVPLQLARHFLIGLTTPHIFYMAVTAQVVRQHTQQGNFRLDKL